MNLNRKHNPISSSPNPSSKMYKPIKCSLRRLYISLLLAVAGSLTTVIFQLKRHRPPASNETLLTHAAIDIYEQKLKQEIDYLLQADFNFNTRTWLRSFSSSSIDQRRRILISRTIRETLVHVPSNDLHRLLSPFKASLSDWSTKQNLHRSDSLSELLDNVKLSIGSSYNSCAVVGNSGTLLKTDHGDLIDSHDFVIRLNNAPTSGLSRNVGSKTTLSFINSNVLHTCARRGGCFCHSYGDSVPTVMYVCQPVHFVDYSVCNASRRGVLIVTDLRFDELCARIVKYYSLRRFVEIMGMGTEKWAAAHDGENFHYSSGMQAVMLAVGVCKRVSLFGFGKSDGARHHYHTRQSWELSLHDYEAEYEFYRDLVAGGGAVPFVSGEFEFPRVAMYH